MVQFLSHCMAVNENAFYDCRHKGAGSPCLWNYPSVSTEEHIVLDKPAGHLKMKLLKVSQYVFVSALLSGIYKWGFLFRLVQASVSSRVCVTVLLVSPGGWGQGHSHGVLTAWLQFTSRKTGLEGSPPITGTAGQCKSKLKSCKQVLSDGLIVPGKHDGVISKKKFPCVKAKFPNPVLHISKL